MYFCCNISMRKELQRSPSPQQKERVALNGTFLNVAVVFIRYSLIFFSYLLSVDNLLSISNWNSPLIDRNKIISFYLWKYMLQFLPSCFVSHLPRHAPLHSSAVFLLSFPTPLAIGLWSAVFPCCVFIFVAFEVRVHLVCFRFWWFITNVNLLTTNNNWMVDSYVKLQTSYLGSSWKADKQNLINTNVREILRFCSAILKRLILHSIINSNVCLFLCV